LNSVLQKNRTGILGHFQDIAFSRIVDTRLAMSGVLRLSTDITAAKKITKGTIYDQRRKCGHKKCRCFAGQLHETKVISFNEKGKTRLISLTKHSTLELSRIEQQVAEYQRFRKSRAKIVRYFKQLIAEINKLERSLLIGVDSMKGKHNGKKKTK
jgi:hypothetical protein